MTRLQPLMENCLIFWPEKGEKGIEVTERILHLNQETDLAITFDVRAPNALPESQTYSGLVKSYKQNQFCVFEGVFEELIIPINPKPSQIKTRDRRLDRLAPILNSGLAMYYPNLRGELINQTLKAGGYTKNTVYKLLRQYWRYGQHKDGLLGFENRRGRKKDVDLPEGSRKVGRPKKDPTLPPGINTTTGLTRRMRGAYYKYYGGCPTLSVTDAWIYFLGDQYSIEIDKDENGRPNRDIPDIETLPSYGQFYYRTHAHPETRIKGEKRRNGVIKIERNYSSSLDSVFQWSFGPGHTYLIDSTQADIELVHPIHRDLVIGKPTIYFNVDCYSFSIVSIEVTLENPSWMSQGELLRTIIEDKSELCGNSGINISIEEWPQQGLPRAFLGDRGEAMAKAAERLLSIEITFGNTPPYRPDKKALVEALFEFLKKYGINLVPGGGKYDPVRGDLDPRGRPSLTSSEFKNIMLEFTLFWNKTHVIKDYPFDSQMLADKVLPRPNDLWNWGIEHRTGLLRVPSGELIFQKLLPREKATSNHKGLEFKGNYYYSQSLHDENKFLKPNRITNSKTESHEIAYNPRNMRAIYLISPSNMRHPFEHCEILESSAGYAELSAFERDIQTIIEDSIKRKLSNEQIRERIKLRYRIEKISEDASKATDEVVEQSGSEPNANTPKRTKRENRASAKELEREGRYGSTIDSANENLDNTTEVENLGYGAEVGETYSGPYIGPRYDEVYEQSDNEKNSD